MRRDALNSTPPSTAWASAAPSAWSSAAASDSRPGAVMANASWGWGVVMTGIYWPRPEFRPRHFPSLPAQLPFAERVSFQHTANVAGGRLGATGERDGA